MKQYFSYLVFPVISILNIAIMVLTMPTAQSISTVFFDPDNHPFDRVSTTFYKPNIIQPPLLNFDTDAIASILERTITTSTALYATKPSIAYLCADIKYNNGSLKICEINPVPGVASSEYNVMVNNKNYRVCCPFWKAFWHYVKQFEIPVWLVGPIIDPKALDFTNFFEHEYGYHQSLDDLIIDPIFINNLQRSSAINNKSSFKHYGGLIIYNPPMGKTIVESHIITEKFQQQYPDFLLLNNIAQWFTGDKDLMSQIFLDPMLQQFKPWWKSYKKQYTPTLATEIVNDCNTPFYVFKPINGTWSGGTTIVPQENLDEILTLLFDLSHKKYATGKQNLDYWKTNLNDSFIIEEFVQSQTITINGNIYNPTLRLAFIITHERNSMSITLLGGGWKTPLIPLDQDGDLIKKHITLGLPGEFCGQLINPHDFAMLQNIMGYAGPQIYTAMLMHYDETKKIYLARSKNSS